MGYLDITDKQNKNLTIPFSMAIVYMANYADYFLKHYQTLVWNEQFTNFICDNILNKLRIILNDLVKVCQNEYNKRISRQEIISYATIVINIISTMISYIAIIVIGFKLIGKRHSILAGLGYISNDEIKKILEMGKSCLPFIISSENSFNNSIKNDSLNANIKSRSPDMPSFQHLDDIT